MPRALCLQQLQQQLVVVRYSASLSFAGCPRDVILLHGEGRFTRWTGRHPVLWQRWPPLHRLASEASLRSCSSSSSSQAANEGAPNLLR